MKPQVLIIEDNQSDQLLTQTILESLGFECTVAFDGEAAMKIAMDKTFDLILLDLLIPKISGVQFLIGFRSLPLLKNTPVVVVSAREDEAAESLSKSLGAAAFILKPICMSAHKEYFSKFLKPSNEELRYE